jgi:hypothetical protein
VDQYSDPCCHRAGGHAPMVAAVAQASRGGGSVVDSCITWAQSWAQLADIDGFYGSIMARTHPDMPGTVANARLLCHNSDRT